MEVHSCIIDFYKITVVKMLCFPAEIWLILESVELLWYWNQYLVVRVVGKVVTLYILFICYKKRNTPNTYLKGCVYFIRLLNRLYFILTELNVYTLCNQICMWCEYCCTKLINFIRIEVSFYDSLIILDLYWICKLNFLHPMDTKFILT